MFLHLIMKYLVLFTILIAPFGLLASPIISLKKGLVIKSSVTIKQEIYLLDAFHNLNQPLIIVNGNDIVVDFNDAVLQGSNHTGRPDEFFGLAIYIEKGSRNITLKNANVHGYKIAILADSVHNLVLDKCDLSYNYKQHLHSNIFREDVSDWMNYHHNENDEWQRYGAAIYLKSCSSATISNNILTGGQCALMMTNCNKAEIYKNNFSFNSGIGIGLYRSSNNRIYNNILDFNVRGYSEGIYHRGQDSAGVLVFEQCNNNIFAYNSVTHSGDGFFLWAGQYTMDTGKGGCNDNLIYGNNFSYAATNGVEVTFSKNNIDSNIIKECDNGIWAGYSYYTNIINNNIEGNKTGIAIENGQQNFIMLDHFKNDVTAIKLWSRSSQPANWSYAQKRDTRSRRYSIVSNRFENEQTVFDIMGTDSISFEDNRKKDCEEIFRIGEHVTNIDTMSEAFPIVRIDRDRDERLDGINFDGALFSDNELAGRKFIRLTQWGPYNYKYPFIWLNKIDSNGLYHFDVLGPSGSWKIIESKGWDVIEQGEHSLPSFILAKPGLSDKKHKIELEFIGEAFTDQTGKRHSNQPYLFSYKRFDPHGEWKVKFYKWDKNHDPNKNYKQFLNVFYKKPLLSDTASNIDYTWWGSIGKGLPADSFATIATTTMVLPDNTYEIAVTADDLVKVYIDGKLVINRWNAKATVNNEELHHKINMRLSGKHTFKIIHAENAGLATLMFYLHPASYALP